MDTNELRRQLFKDPSYQIYAVVDGAAVLGLLEKIDNDEIESACLLRGEIPVDVEESAPYLIKLVAEHNITSWIIEQSLLKPCCIFAQSKESFLTVRKQFRVLLSAILPDGAVVYFRYYDPRVMKTYLETCPENECKKIYKAINRFILQEKDKYIYFEQYPSGIEDTEDLDTANHYSFDPPHISLEQIRLFSEIEKNKFINHIIQQIKEFFPDFNQQLVPNELREFIQRRIIIAKIYDIKNEDDVFKFINLSIVFGEGFTSLPWAKKILDDPEQDDPSVKMNTLYDVGISVV